MIALLGVTVPQVSDVPVDPGAEEARRWIVAELAKPAYQAAQPTWFDRLSAAFWHWLNSLQFGSGGASLPVMLIVVIVVAAAVVAAFLIFGAPRRNRRSAVTGALFGDDDDRSARAIRASADAAAAARDWTLAIEELFRSIARGLAERTVVTASPGTTARDFATRAGVTFPALAARLAGAASAFDEVRYLGRTGTEETYRELAGLETELRSARPELETAGAAAGGAGSLT
ncbi:DUF4129 domain-containing protein [Parafrigoribacterium soli]|uniref:DUF4129 domain-containing protein n=1 Tax=Parafrigoribacterium soli TaxID=3144663 RepID=UPI0032EFD375